MSFLRYSFLFQFCLNITENLAFPNVFSQKNKNKICWEFGKDTIKTIIIQL